MPEYVQVGVTGDFQDGTKKKVTAAGREILLAKVGGSFYAVASKCPHLGGDLAAGTLEGVIVTCPRHASQFDIRNGQNVRWMKGSGLAAAIGKAFKSPRGIDVYKVKIDGDRISVEV